MTHPLTTEPPPRDGAPHLWWASLFLLLLVLLGTVCFTVESFQDQDPTLDLIAAVILFLVSITVGWAVVIFRRIERV